MYKGNDPVVLEVIEKITNNLANFLPDYIDENVDIRVDEVIKGNDQKLLGVFINEPAIKMSPTIYIDSMIDRVKEGKDIDSVLADIAGIYVEHRTEENMLDLDKLLDYESVKDRIVTKVVNTELNKEYLADAPHKEIGDLSVFCQILIGEMKEGNASITIRDSLINQWNVSFDEVLENAQANDTVLTKPQLIPMQDMMENLMFEVELRQESFLPEKKEYSMPMFVLSTTDKINGAKYILIPNVMDEIGDYLEQNFIVLPSSNQEAIIVPVNHGFGFNLDELTQMVQSINETEVSASEILSDHVYIYDREAKMLTYEKDGQTVVMDLKKEQKEATLEKIGIKAKLEASLKKVSEQKMDHTKQRSIEVARG